MTYVVVNTVRFASTRIEHFSIDAEVEFPDCAVLSSPKTKSDTLQRMQSRLGKII